MVSSVLFVINKYSCIDLFNRKAFFLNYFFKGIDLCSRSVFIVINEQKDNVSVHFLCDEIVSDDPCAARFPFAFDFIAIRILRMPGANSAPCLGFSRSDLPKLTKSSLNEGYFFASFFAVTSK